MTDVDALAMLRAENARLTALLDAHGIAWRLPPQAQTPTVGESSRLTTDAKVALFRTLFRGRSDVYPVRLEGNTPAKPKCASSTSWTPAIRPCCGCGTSGNGAIGRWAIASIRVRRW